MGSDRRLKPDFFERDIQPNFNHVMIFSSYCRKMFGYEDDMKRESDSMNEAVQMIICGSTVQSVQGMSIVARTINNFQTEADELVRCLVCKVGDSFDREYYHELKFRSGAHVMNTLIQIFENRFVAVEVGVSTLGGLITELLSRMSYETVVKRISDGEKIHKAMHVLMWRILCNAQKTASFVVLIKLLRPLKYPERTLGQWYDDGIYNVRYRRFCQLVIKCLFNLTNFLDTMDAIDPEKVLRSIHKLLRTIGKADLMGRTLDAEQSLRMVKSLLHKLIHLGGVDTIRAHCVNVVHSDHDPAIFHYVDALQMCPWRGGP